MKIVTQGGQMGKTVAMAVGPGFEDLEYWAVYLRVREAGATVLSFGDVKGATLTSKSGGLTAKADYSVAEARAANPDLVLIPGGWAPDALRRNRTLIDWIRERDAAGAGLGFICHAGWLAASAQILQGRRCTGSLGIKDDLVNAGGVWVDEPAFRDGHLIWGRIVADIPDYNRLIAAFLEA